MIGQLLDRRYQVVQVLGSGGFGQTYIAQDTRRPGNPTCVVKHLKPASSDPKVLGIARRLFKNEAETLEQLGYHDQIPRLLAYFEENQEFYLVQEFVEGHRLSTELQHNQRWNENQVIQLLQEVLSVLEFVHSKGVIHRDVKPDNLIRRRLDNKLVLVDFGAVKQIQTQLVTAHGQPTASVAIGTPGYMATEQGQGKPRPNSDIYALGIIGIQALTGVSPTRLQSLEDPDTGELSWQKLASISLGLENVLAKMVRYHFKDRYQSATETLQALQQVLSSYYYTPTQSATPQQGITVQPSGIPRLSPPKPISKPSTGSNFSVNHSSFPAGATTSQASGVSSPRQWTLLIGSGIAAIVVAVGLIKAIDLLPQSDKPAPVTSVSPSPNSVPKTNQRATAPSPGSDSTPQPKATPSPSPSFDSTPQPKVTPSPSPSFDSTPQPKATPSPSPSFDSTPQPKATPSPSPSSDSTPQPFEPPPEPDQLPLEPDQPPPDQVDQLPNPDQPSPNSSVDEGPSILEQAKAELDAGNVTASIHLLQSISPDSLVFRDAENLIAQVEQMRSTCESNPYWGQKQGFDPATEPNLEPGDKKFTQATEWNQFKCWNFYTNQW